MKIPATVISGFLGAGKTTLIRHLLENADGRRIALIINEFGDLGIDREILTGCGIESCDEGDIVELANGCICCTVADDFLPTMESLLNRDTPPDHIVIETSGLALPKPLIKAFTWPEVRSKVTVDGVIAVVDGPAVAAGLFADDPVAVQALRDADPSYEHDNPLEEVFTDQLLAADMILLNKSDLLVDGEEARVKSDITAQVREGVHVLSTRHGRVSVEVLLGLKAAAEDDLAARPSCHDGEDEHDHDDFDSFIVALADVADPAALESRIAAAIRDHPILRIKGFVHVPGSDMRHVVQAAGPRIERYYDRSWGDGEARQSRLVVIGEA
ncbi:MAG: cobalamin biosynthesis protein CobW, partial [Rhodospirillales bacterium]|nr:cobalamin biosynthesis protein CobW [Rhodospirillales bacterium]